jgi:hypothetical protein
VIFHHDISPQKGRSKTPGSTKNTICPAGYDKFNTTAALGAALAKPRQINSVIRKSCQAPKSKIFRLPNSANQNYKGAILGPHEGRFAIVTKRRAEGVMDALASGVDFCYAGRKR